MKRLPLFFAGAIVLTVLGILSSIVTQGFQDLARAEEEHRRFSEEKARLEHRIGDLRRTLQALKTDPRAVESLARQDLGWVRPGERVIVLATPTPPAAPQPSTEPTPTPFLRWPHN